METELESAIEICVVHKENLFALIQNDLKQKVW